MGGESCTVLRLRFMRKLAMSPIENSVLKLQGVYNSRKLRIEPFRCYGTLNKINFIKSAPREFFMNV